MCTYNNYLPGLLAICLCCLSCNPDCPPIPGLQLSSGLNPPGFEVLISASPPSALLNKRVFFGDTEVTPRFAENLGLIVTVPDGVSGDMDLRIEDGDCIDYVSLDFNVVDANFFVNNPNFISPTPPNIVIPTLPATFPAVLDKSWLSPDNLDYCLWFIMIKDVEIQGTDTIFHTTNTLDPLQSFELSTCRNTDALYEGNPMFGIIDRDLNYINIWIDRSHRGSGFGIEEYTGRFIEIEGTDYDVPHQGCGTTFEHKGHLMLLQSKQTGRQVLAFQNG